MSSVAENGKKWIQSGVAITCMLLGYILISFFETMGDWFELESKVPNFVATSQVLAVLIALGTFVYIMKNPKISSFLREVYQETAKVVWPDKIATNRHTIGIMIGVTIVGFILGFFDFVATWLLSLIN
ncbi:MAG: preprotein translocase subunit SecE [Bacteriovoracaceae bacterium]